MKASSLTHLLAGSLSDEKCVPFGSSVCTHRQMEPQPFCQTEFVSKRLPGVTQTWIHAAAPASSVHAALRDSVFYGAESMGPIAGTRARSCVDASMMSTTCRRCEASGVRAWCASGVRATRSERWVFRSGSRQGWGRENGQGWGRIGGFHV